MLVSGERRDARGERREARGEGRGARGEGRGAHMCRGAHGSRLFSAGAAPLWERRPRREGRCPGALGCSRPGGRSYNRGRGPWDRLVPWEWHPCGSGALAAKDVAPVPWDVRGRVAAPTIGAEDPGTALFRGSGTLVGAATSPRSFQSTRRTSLAAAASLPREVGVPQGQTPTPAIACSQPGDTIET